MKLYLITVLKSSQNIQPLVIRNMMLHLNSSLLVIQELGNHASLIELVVILLMKIMKLHLVLSSQLLRHRSIRKVSLKCNFGIVVDKKDIIL
jgi:hypothetical protein